MATVRQWITAISSGISTSFNLHANAIITLHKISKAVFFWFSLICATPRDELNDGSRDRRNGVGCSLLDTYLERLIKMALHSMVVLEAERKRAVFAVKTFFAQSTLCGEQAKTGCSMTVDLYLWRNERKQIQWKQLETCRLVNCGSSG